MSWLYPERWPGWMDHARVGGGVFDDGPGLVQILSACWRHFSTASGMASRIALSPPPKLSVIFREDVLSHPQWGTSFAYASEHFRPEISGVALPFTFQPPDENEGPNLAEPRHFTFVLESPQHQHMTCFFYLDQRVVGAMDLGQVNLLGDRRQLAIQRRLGMTRGSDIETCYRSSPLWAELPDAMQRDLRYLGWTFGFATQSGAPKITIDTVPAMGFLEGGELLLTEGSDLQAGVAFDFYQGLRHERPDPGLRCRMLLVPKGVQPARPAISDAECFLHPAQSKNDAAWLDIRVWVDSAPMRSEVSLLMTNDQGAAIQPSPIALEGGQPCADGRLLFEAMCPVPGLAIGQTLQLSLTGQNQFGLAFASHEQHRATLRQAVSLSLPERSLLSTAQLRREWELVAHCIHDGSPPTFDLSAVTLWLQSGAHPPVQLPLASTTPGKLLFRYLPKSISQQLPIEKLASGDVLRMWISQTRSDRPMPEGAGWLSQQGNRPDAPICQYRLLDFDTDCRLLPAGTSLRLRVDDEIAIERTRLQLISGLKSAEDDASSAFHTLADLVLLERQGGLREITLTHQGAGWMSTAQPTSENQSSTTNGNAAIAPRRIRALWLSCAQVDQWIQTPAGRNPEGGPCIAFGLGVGSTQEMAQIRPTEDGFRLYRHRQHIPVQLGAQQLPTEPYQEAQGQAIEADGWMLIDSALLRYQQTSIDGQQQLHLSHFGYLYQRQTQASKISLTCGPDNATGTDEAAAMDAGFHLHIAGSRRPGRLTLTAPEPPPPDKVRELWMQLQGLEHLPSPLEYGKTYEHGSLHWSVWHLTPANGLTTATPALGTPETALQTPVQPIPQQQSQRIFLELRRTYGRKRFALSTRRGRLGFWREGSAFFSMHTPGSSGTRPVMTQDSPRQLQNDQMLPPGALLFGTDITQADLLLPMHMGLPALPFALRWHQGTLSLLPLQPKHETHKIQLHRFPGGELSIKDDTEEQTQEHGIDITPVEGGKSFFRCRDVVFEVSRSRDDLHEQQQADVLLSIRGLCHTIDEELHAIPIGGPHHLTPLPLLDPVPPFAPDLPLVTLYPPALHLNAEGEALFGLQQSTPSHSLLAQLQRALRTTTREELHNDGPLRFLGALAKAPTGRRQHPSPQETQPATPDAWLHEHRELPAHFITDGDALRVGPLTLTYRFRQREDGHPTVDRAPAWLALTPSEDVVLTPAKEKNQLKLPSGKCVDAMLIGRADPEQKREQIAPETKGELHLSVPFPAASWPGEERNDAHTWAKLLLTGYAPRHAARLRWDGKDGAFWLDVPPSPEGQYHLTIAGEPARDATSHRLVETIQLHINHLLQLQLTPLFSTPDKPEEAEKDTKRTCRGLRVELLGYLLGHQGDPARPMRIARANRVGRVHLRTPGDIPQIALQTALCPPHFRREGEQSLGPWMIEGQRVSLVDLQAWQPTGPLAMRPTGCDRLLWFDNATNDDEQNLSERAFLFPTTPQTPSSGSNMWNDEGSSFAFGGDEGSSFAFGPSTATPVETQTQEELVAAFPAMSLGWHTPADTETNFGYTSTLEGPKARLYQTGPGTWALAPEEGAISPYPTQHRISEERQVPLALWDGGHWQPLRAPVQLARETLLRCGPAGFHIALKEDGESVVIERRWLWLPARQTLVLTQGTTPRETLPESHWLGLGGKQDGLCCEIWPLRRGHMLLTETPDDEDAEEDTAHDATVFHILEKHNAQRETEE